MNTVIESCGGVIVNGEGKVLLREPTGHFDGYVWTFPKGQPKPGESAEVTALREVLEETGVEAKILKRLPGSFVGGTGETVYFLMRPVRKTGCWDRETRAVCWVSQEEAEHLIAETTNLVGRARDLQVLAAAFEALV